ncbi:hypothetical protein Zmor_028266 [Zophobas morio]|uniref:Uncharacterized protein n=1 Tax=Zophobas morio TaxID=2755281 RepID=A0AA38HQ80_9CUCU|nr:hypothetical protein Zmor_028266 [Zophobas morio]
MVPDSDDKLSQRREVNWLCILFNLQVSVSFICSLHFVFYEAKLLTTIYTLVLVLLTLIGVTAGAHRLWAHHSYEATTSLRIFLMLCQTLAGHTSIYNWVRLHRLHHKHFQTDLDPYNPRKGFLYSHFICNSLKLSPAQEKLLDEIDMSDLENDKVVMFQKKYYWILFAIFTLLLPINAPVEYWGDTILSSVFVVGWLRFAVTYHLSLLIHSGLNVFDFNFLDRNAFDSNQLFFVNRSYWLSYHYLVPWDYQTSEYGKYGTDCTTKFIRVCVALDIASDLKTVNGHTIREVLKSSVDEKESLVENIDKLKNVGEDGLHKNYLLASRLH